MPVSVQTPLIEYTGNGSTKIFAYPFRILKSTDLRVYLNGVLTTTGYTVSGVGVSTGGSVTFTTAPASGITVKLQRSIDLDRTTDYVEGGALRANVLDDDIDRTVMMVQDTRVYVDEQIDIVEGEIDAVEGQLAGLASLIAAGGGGTGGNGAWLNIQDFGADPTGVADSAAAIQTAINAASALKVGIYAPVGTYKVNSTLTKPTTIASGYTHYFMGIKGDGPQATIFNFAGLTSGNAISIESVPQGSVYQDFAVQGPGIATGTHSGMHFPCATTDPGLDHTGVYGCTFRNIWVKEFSQHGFWWVVPYVCTMEMLLAQDIGDKGFFVDYDHGPLGTNWVGGTSLQFTSCYANFCLGTGYHFEPLVYSSLTSCAADDCTIGYGFYGCAGMSMDGIGYELASPSITGNCRAIYLHGPSGVTDVSTSLAFSGVSIGVNGSAFSSFYCVEMAEAQNCTFVGGHCYYAPDLGVKQPAHEILIQENGAYNEWNNCTYYSDTTTTGGTWRVNANTWTDNQNISKATGSSGYIVADTNAAGVTNPTDDSTVLEVKGNVMMYPVPGDASGKVGFDFFNEDIGYVTLALHSNTNPSGPPWGGSEIVFGGGVTDLDAAMTWVGTNTLTYPKAETPFIINGTAGYSSMWFRTATGYTADTATHEVHMYLQDSDGSFNISDDYHGGLNMLTINSRDGSATAGDAYFYGKVYAANFVRSGGTAITTSNVALTSGWGSSTKDVVDGTDGSGRVYIICAGTLSAYPTVTVTYTATQTSGYKPIVTSFCNTTSAGYGNWCVTSYSSTGFTVVYNGTPTSSDYMGFLWTLS